MAAALAVGIRHRWTARFKPLAPAAWTALSVVLWVLLAAVLNSGQFADSIEQFVWAHSFETGYWKHPPLPSWLLRGAILGAGFWSGWTYVLAALCFAGTAFFTWRIALLLCGDRVATMAVLLLGLHLGFSQRAQLYNHNTVLLLFCAMTVWATLRAIRSARTRDWLLAGACAGLAVLAKYQAILIISGCVIAMAMSSRTRNKATLRGCGWAMVACAATLSPHLDGLLSRDSAPVGYALSNFRDLPLRDAAHSVLAHLANQMRFHIPMLVAIGLASLLQRAGMRPDPESTPAAPTESREELRAWMIGLVAWPILFMVTLPLITGLRLHAQWGLGAFQFAVIPIAMAAARAMPSLSVRTLWRAALLAQCINLLMFLSTTLDARAGGSRIERKYPAQALAKAVQQDWDRVTRCPLRYVSGPTFEAGLVSVYSGGYPAVLEQGDPRKSPWIDPAAMQRDGYVTLHFAQADRPTGSGMKVPLRGEDTTSRLEWVITPPDVECERVNPSP